MSQYIDDCNEQNEHIESLIRKMLYHDSDNNFYINMIDSGLSESDVTPISDCEDYRSLLQLFRLSIGEDIDGNPAINTVSITEGTVCIDTCTEQDISTSNLLYQCFYQDASGNIYLGVKQGFDSEVAAILNAFTGTYTTEQKNALNTFIVGVKDLFSIDTLNQKFDVFYILAAANTHDAQLNLCNLLNNTITEANAPTYTAFRGYTGNGINAYLNTNYNPSTQGVNVLQNSRTSGVYCRTNNIVNATAFFGAFNFASPYFHLGITTTNYQGRINQDGAGNFNTAHSSNLKGLLTVNRGDANSIMMRQNTNELQTLPTVSNGLSASNNILLSLSSVLNFTTNELAFHFDSSYMTKVENDSFIGLLETYLDVIGAGVL